VRKQKHTKNTIPKRLTHPANNLNGIEIKKKT